MDYTKLSTADLFLALKDALATSAHHLTKAAKIWMELRSRGADLSNFPPQLHKVLPMIAADEIDAAIVPLCAWDSTLLQRLKGFPKERQMALASGKEEVAVYRPSGVEKRPLPLLPMDELCRVLKEGKVVPVAAQKAEYEKAKAEKLPKAINHALPLNPEFVTKTREKTWRQTFKLMWERGTPADQAWARERMGKSAKRK